MRGRREARRLAIDVLYEADIRGTLPTDALAARESGGWVVATEDDLGPTAGEEGERTPGAFEYARSLVEGVQAHQVDADALISGFADKWAIERMPVIDRTLLRLALFEILWGKDVPPAIAINEAVELAKQLSTEDSGKFINGLLGRIADNMEEIAGIEPV